MPEMDGLEATRYINANWKSDEKPTIVAMTANVMHGDKDSASMQVWTIISVSLSWLKTYKKLLSNGQILQRHAKLLKEEILKQSLMLDSDIIYGLKELDDSNNFKEVINLYLEVAPALIDDIKLSFKKQEFDNLKKSAYNLKRASLNLGAKQARRSMFKSGSN